MNHYYVPPYCPYPLTKCPFSLGTVGMLNPAIMPVTLEEPAAAVTTPTPDIRESMQTSGSQTDADSGILKDLSDPIEEGVITES